LNALRLIVASVTFLLWVASVVAYLFFSVPIDPWVHILTMAIFSFLFGPGVWRSVRGGNNGSSDREGRTRL